MDDAISRKAAIEEIARWIGYLDEDMILQIQTGLKKLPSVKPEQKKGKWHRRFYPYVEMIVCSECQEEFSYDAETGVRNYNYCPNCGADMRGAEDG